MSKHIYFVFVRPAQSAQVSKFVLSAENPQQAKRIAARRFGRWLDQQAMLLLDAAGNQISFWINARHRWAAQAKGARHA